MATLSGTPGDDTIVGTDQADFISGGAGNDTLLGLGGDDRLFGEGGDDLLDGGEAADTLFGGAGDDTLIGGAPGPGPVPADALHGGPGRDMLRGAGLLDGGDGGDRIVVSPGPASQVIGGDGNDDIRGEFGTFGSLGTVDGGAGDDVIRGGEGTETLSGGPGNDSIDGYEGSDLIRGDDGDDVLSALTADAAVGGAIIHGGAGNDSLRGGFMTPAMYGEDGDDVLTLGRFELNRPPAGFVHVFDGGPGFDTLALGPRDAFALAADDRVFGIERIDMSGRASTLTVDVQGVLGASDTTDRLVVHGSADDRVEAIGAWTAAGQETIDGQVHVRYQLGGASLVVNAAIAGRPPGPALLVGTDANETLSGTAGGETILGGAGSDTLLGADGDDVLHGGSAGDFLAGDGGDHLDGGRGNDLLNGGAGPDVFVFRAGHDRIVWFEDGIDRIDFSSFGDTTLAQLAQRAVIASGVRASGAPYTEWSFGSGDVLTVEGVGALTAEDVILAPNRAPIIGTAGNDRIVGSSGSETIDGREGGDVLLGNAGNDILHGGDPGDFLAGDGGDRLDGGPGDDLLNGGAGPDVYVFAPGYGADRVVWFEDGLDRLDLRGFGVATAAQLAQRATGTAATQPGGAPSLTLDFQAGDAITLVGIGQIDGADLVA